MHPQPIILYGGTFDPVHHGHLAVARAARDALDAQVRLLPAADPPHRAPPGASAAQRAAMLELAVAGEDRIAVDRCELERAGRSYTADTLQAWRRRCGQDTPLIWLLGADAFRALPSWHRWPELFDLAHWMVAARPGHALDALPEPLASALAGRLEQRPEALLGAPAGRVWQLPLPLRAESATGVRTGVGEAGGGWRDEVPDEVAAYIRRQGLYGDAGPVEGAQRR